MARAAEFQADHGRLPRRHTGDAAEEKMAMWLYHTRRLHSRGELSAERIKQLDDSFGNWRTPGRTRNEEAGWDARVAELQAFISAAGRLPQRSNNASEAEWALALFVNRQRSRVRNGTLAAGRGARLDKAAPGGRQARFVTDPDGTGVPFGVLGAGGPHAPVILAGLASGRSPAEMARMTGVPQQLLFGLARHNTE